MGRLSHEKELVIRTSWRYTAVDADDKRSTMEITTSAIYIFPVNLLIVHQKYVNKPVKYIIYRHTQFSLI
jgi:hypothetical protein